MAMADTRTRVVRNAEAPMKYQYQMGGVFAEVIEGVLKGGYGAYKKAQDDKKAEVDKKIATADSKAAAAAPKKDEKPGIIDRVTAPIKDAAKQQAKNDITKWALIYLGLWLLLKGK